MQRAQSILKDVFGFAKFWPLQEKIIAHILEKKDDRGNPTGLSIGKDTLEEMANKIKMHTAPILYPSINVKTFGPGEIVELEIPESDNKPVFAFEKAYVRVGKANQKLSATEIRDLVKRYTLPDFDQRVLCKQMSDKRLRCKSSFFHHAQVQPQDPSMRDA